MHALIVVNLWVTHTTNGRDKTGHLKIANRKRKYKLGWGSSCKWSIYTNDNMSNHACFISIVDLGVEQWL